AAISTRGEEIDFTRDVRPILSENCFHCHGPDAKARKGELRLDSEADVKRDRDGYAVVTPGQSEKSELFRRLVTHDEDDLMPPADSNRTLTTKEIETVRKWIDDGGEWGLHWSFTPVERPALTDNKAHPIDELVSRVHEQRKITPTKQAERETLIRRAALDLTGFPPTPDRVASFLNDNSPGAWEQVVDHYLASPAFGERMAWDWLEAARYADTNGYQGDRERTMWPWRDWVVKAYNENLSFDQFTIWQLAGDLLPNATEEQILATGFNRNYMINGEGGRIAEENRVDYVMDMSETMGTIWLGLTMNCCRCHDHKFDPLTQRDYYSLYAFFDQTPVTGAGGDPQTKPILAVASPDQKAQEEKFQADYTKALGELSALAKKLNPGQREWELKRKGGTDWQPLKAESVAADEQTLTPQKDRSILATGPHSKDTYTLTFQGADAPTRAIRLEALQHESFTNDGKGLSRSDSGNFVLTEIEILANGKPVQIASAKASFEQRSFKISGAYDGDPTTGWAVFDGKGVVQPQEAIFVLESPVPAGADWQFTLRHDSRYEAHTIGRVRLSSTADGTPRIEKEDAEFLTALRKDPDKRTKEETSLVGQTYRNSHSEYLALKAVSDAAKKRLDDHRKTIPKVMVMEDMEKPRKTFLLDRGLYNQPGEEITAAVPALFPQIPEGTKSDRLALAQWLVTRENPLTARVTVNRIWQMIFGTGLVKTVEDFGVQSEYPVHSELLDWLAAEFMESGWDTKHLLKTILLSETYRLGSEIDSPSTYENDPDNRLLARGPRFRMTSWMIRDQALASSGLLNTRFGGPSVNGYQPPGIWEEATFGKKTYTQVKGEDLYRRSLYTFWRRIIGPTMFFDSAKRQICEVKTARTNTPMHALATLNDVTFVEAARALAERVMKAEPQEQARLELIGKLILARTPSDEELTIWKRGLQRAHQTFKADPAAAAAFLKNGESARDESLPAAQHAAYANLCLMLLNLDETLTKE
ncbi:MAG: PSD1 and planctomycete cytochrome C domain-containing protein, partial [Verrucomicrobiales bacterium]|nr:PSD1 and planctomycete cytochrome C domain-containing protein [Verrucomicrobiales bacterium]